MPDKRTHRGPNPQDRKLFTSSSVAVLRAALDDFSMLLTKNYAEKSALKLVGDRFELTKRQRLAILRCACSAKHLESRSKRRIALNELAGRAVAIDGYNLLITIEAALSGGLIFLGRDGCFKDLASVHGTYRKVTETIPAIELIGDFLKQAKIGKALWLLDKPVSNSGRLKKIILEIAEAKNWDWQVELVFSPDKELIETELAVATTDSIILQNCKSWVNLAAEIIRQRIPSARIIDLSGSDRVK